MLEQQVQAHAGRSAGRGARRATSPASGCSCGTCANVVPEHEAVPRLRRQPAPGHSAGDRAASSSSIMREDRSVLELLTADYTFVNERLARHYGIPDVYGSQFRRVPVTDDSPPGPARAGQHPDRDVARRTARRRCCAASGFSRTCSARRRRRRPPTCRRSRRTSDGDQADDDARADGRAPRQPGRAPAATG